MVSQGHALSRDELVRALVAHTGITTTDGALTNDTLVDAALIGYDQRKIVEKTILISSGDSNIEDAAATAFNPATGEITVSPAFSNQILAGTVYRIINISTVELDVINILARIGTNLDPAGTTTLFAWLARIWAGLGSTEGLVYHGVVTAAAAPSFTIDSLAGLGAGKFSDAVAPYWAFVLRDAGGASVLPQGQMRVITGYDTATGQFTCPVFDAEIAVDDEVLIIPQWFAQIVTINTTVAQIYNIVNAILTDSEVGGTLTTDGTEQILWENNAPFGVFEPMVLKLDFTNHTLNETVMVRFYERIRAGGGLVEFDHQEFAGVQDPLGKYIDLGVNRFGVRVTIEKTAGANQDYDWEVVKRD